MFRVAQNKVRGTQVGDAERWIPYFKMLTQVREGEVKNNETNVKKLEKKREQYKGEL